MSTYSKGWVVREAFFDQAHHVVGVDGVVVNEDDDRFWVGFTCQSWHQLRDWADIQTPMNADHRVVEERILLQKVYRKRGIVAFEQSR